MFKFLIEEYIKCHSCDSADTQLLKNERIVFLQCKTCQSKAPVGSIKSGFRAQVVKRSRQRAKDNWLQFLYFNLTK